jgi:RNA polymerase sigma-70 factor (ECF subfamily)
MSFDAILAEQAAPLTRRLLRMVGDRETAEDLRQETLARAWRSAPRGAQAPVLGAWLHRTATNLALDELRRRKRRAGSRGRLRPVEGRLNHRERG